MVEITFLSNKSKKEISKYTFIIIFAVITWILQVSIFGEFSLFNSSFNAMLLGTIYTALKIGPGYGTIFGIICSFLSSNLLYDQIFYISYPLIGLISGLLTKRFFSSEILFFTAIIFLFTFPFEFLNGWQYNLKNPVELLDTYVTIATSSSIINLLFSPLFYLFANFVTKKFKPG